MSSVNDNQGRSYGVQQPKWKRKIYWAHHQWRKQQWGNIMKTNTDSALDTDPTSHWAPVNQAQQEWPNVNGSLDGDFLPSASFDSSLSHRATAEVHTSPLSGVVAGGPPANRYVRNIEMRTMTSHDLQPSTDNTTTQNGSVGQASNFFSGRLDSSLNSLRSSVRIAAALFEGTPSIFRKRKREHFSAPGIQRDDTDNELHVGAGNAGVEPEPNLLNLFPLEPDLKTVTENSLTDQHSLSALVLRSKSRLQLLDLYGCALVFSGNRGEGFVQEDATVQDPFERPPILSSVSSKGSSQLFIDSACHQSSSQPPLNPNVTSLPGNGQSLDSARKLVCSDSCSTFMDKGRSISAVEVSNASASASSTKEASRNVSPSTHATPSRAASKKVSPSICATPSMTASKKVSLSICATPSSTGASKKVLPSTSATPSGRISTPKLGTLLQQKTRPSNETKRHSNQYKGPSNGHEPLFNHKRRRLNLIRRSSDPATTLAVPEENIESSFKGVGYFKRTKRWEAHIWNTKESRQEYLGAFSTEEQAARAYDRATLYFRGVSAKLHFKLEDYAKELPRLEALTKDQLTTMLKKQSKGRGSLHPAYPA